MTVIGIAIIVLLIVMLKMHAFLALTIGALFVGITCGIPLGDVSAVYQLGVGSVLGYVGVLIALGAMLGKLLADSGGADQVVDTLLRGRTRRAALEDGADRVHHRHPDVLRDRPGAADPGGDADRAPDRASRDAAGNSGAGRPVRAARLRPAAPRAARRDRRAARERGLHAGPRPGHRDSDGDRGRAAVRQAGRAHGPGRGVRRRSCGHRRRHPRARRRTRRRPGPPARHRAPGHRQPGYRAARTAARHVHGSEDQPQPQLRHHADHDPVAGRADADQGRLERVDEPEERDLPVPAVHR